ncbi:MAG: beta-N-acetylhexosaminidase [Clostridia bacterium]|nr:beta-N-acetylhexosaminidase [Clostridia bacterium]
MKYFGVMIDMSRNAVMSVSGLKRFMDLLARMGYNCILLYTEDTYEIEKEPYFGYMRGRYTTDELREIDAYGESLGIEIIPCIQTLAHLTATVRWGQFPVDNSDTLLVGHERCYELIDRMFEACSKAFKTKKIHIGMDEARLLGRGRYIDEYGYDTVDNIMKKHMERILPIANKYGYEPMIWSDMLFSKWTGDEYYVGKTQVPQEYIDAMPEGITPVYWDYYHTEEKAYDDMIYNHKQFTDDIWFAGGVWSWAGFAPHNQFSLETMIPALDACSKNGIENIFFTMWGDNGGECSRFALLPSLFYLAEYYLRGNRDVEDIKARFQAFSGIGFDDFMLLDMPNAVGGRLTTAGYPTNAPKYMLLSDCFNGFLDWTVKEGGGAEFASIAASLRPLAEHREYGYLFDNLAKLCHALEIKYELGVKTRAAYESGDLDALKALVDDYAEATSRIESFSLAFEKQWMAENKPQGFDGQELRIGGVLRRLDSCRRKLIEYVEGRADRLPELDEKLLPYGPKGESISFNDGVKNMTVSVLHW